MNHADTHHRYLKLLAQSYPSIQAASTEIVKLTAQLSLPKGTEHFVSDIHGEYEAFRHVLKNCSGTIRRKIDDVFGDKLSAEEKRTLATLIYYPEQKMDHLLKTVDDHPAWLRQTLQRLIAICRETATKYPQIRVEGFLPPQWAPIIEEVLQEQEDIEDRRRYYDRLLDSLIATGSARGFINALAELIQRLVIARLHVIGDVYDRGPGAHLIMDDLIAYHTVDIQWGNHDIVWMGAAGGSDACIANVIRMCLRHANLETLEHGYGISLLPLASFALEAYADDPCQPFEPKVSANEDFTRREIRMMTQMHKAMTIIQFKLEGQIIRRRPYYKMADRLLLDNINYKAGTVRIDGADYALIDSHFPTIDPNQPYVLTEGEQLVVERLRRSFLLSKKLQQHVRFLYSNGSMFRVHNGNLLYHGCIALNSDGSFSAFQVDGHAYKGKAFMDLADRMTRQGYFSDDPERKLAGLDMMWYLWCGSQSPLFGKSKMATFERYLLTDKKPQREDRNPYYDFRDREDVVRRILKAFGADPKNGHIVNGHVPVKVKKGERPVKAKGKLIVIDGGFARAYQKKTGIAGYTLVSNSHGLLLAAHQPFESTQTAIEHEIDLDSSTEIIETFPKRRYVKDTDLGHRMQQQIQDLEALLDAYRSGWIQERL